MSVEQVKKIAAEIVCGDEGARKLLIQTVQWLHDDPVRARRIHAAIHRLLPGGPADFRLFLMGALCVDAGDLEDILLGPPLTEADIAAVGVL